LSPPICLIRQLKFLQQVQLSIDTDTQVEGFEINLDLFVLQRVVLVPLANSQLDRSIDLCQPHRTCQIFTFTSVPSSRTEFHVLECSLSYGLGRGTGFVHPSFEVSSNAISDRGTSFGEGREHERREGVREDGFEVDLLQVIELLRGFSS
jgi:hypothetical protein